MKYSTLSVNAQWPNAGRRIKFDREKGLDSWNFFLRILISRNFFKSCQCKSSNLVKWTQLISAIFSFQLLGIFIHFNLGGFSFNVSFSKRAVQMFVKNIGWLKIAVGDWWIHSTAPGMKTVKRNSERRIPRKSSENRRLFPGANLILRPA